jgi:hypothetical protein
LADAGFYSNQNVRESEARGIDVYVPDQNLERELNTGKRARTIGRNRVRSPQLKAMRKKLRSWAGRRVYERRKTLVELVFGVLKQQRWMRLFRTRGPAKVATEFTLAALAYNLTRRPQAGTGKPTNRGNWRDRKAEQGACQRQTSSHPHTGSAAPPKVGFFSDLFSRAEVHAS